MRSLHGSYLMVSYVMWQLPPALSPESFFSWESLSGQTKSWVEILFDMHSFHNPLASFSNGSHECLTYASGFFLNLMFWDWNENCLYFQNPLFWNIFKPTLISKAERSTFQPKENMHLLRCTKKKKITERFRRKLWSLVIWWSLGLAGCLGCKDWKSTNEGLLLVQD